MNYAFLIAGGVSAFACVLLLLLGGTRPVDLAAEPATAADAWFGRRLISVTLLGLAIGYGHAARSPSAGDLGVALTAAAVVMPLLHIAATRVKRAEMPQLIELASFAAIAALGGFGLTAG
ncbi:hypothetical protein GC169_08180 [bacterium]|nr:hypothetical protein [bacterium]